MEDTLLTALAMTVTLFLMSLSLSLRWRLLQRHEELVRRSHDEGRPVTALLGELTRETTALLPHRRTSHHRRTP